MRLTTNSDNDRRTARLVIELVAYATDLDPEAIFDPRRGTRAAALARQMAMYLTNVSFCWSMNRVAVAFERDRSTVAHACQQVETRREDPDIDACLSQLELLLERAPERGGARRALEA
jgi:chromosomal replication initiation ATPase DnaA